MACMADLTDAKRRIIERLKRSESVTASELATQFRLTDTAIRQHLEALEASGLVTRTQGVAAGRGRPPVQWSLAPLAMELFPDRHADLTVELIQSIRQSLGDDALNDVIRTRRERQLAAYRGRIDPDSDVAVKVRLLADIRTAEGYLAEATSDGDALVLTEHHCPIRDAAGACLGLCTAELELFRETLGSDVSVERDQHLLAGAQRCSYRISRR
ncbi:MAG: transcriptional regulator [Ilumatobacteraceae bacterium]|nr:transcriptional regulator [Ilumatobacteraceae bacterium]